MGNRSNINLVGNTTQGQNVSSGEGVYKGKDLGNLLQFKSLSVTGTTMAITCDADNIYFSANTGGGGTSYWDRAGTTLSTLNVGDDVRIDEDSGLVWTGATNACIRKTGAGLFSQYGTTCTQLSLSSLVLSGFQISIGCGGCNLTMTTQGNIFTSNSSQWMSIKAGNSTTVTAAGGMTVAGGTNNSNGFGGALYLCSGCATSGIGGNIYIFAGCGGGTTNGGDICMCAIEGGRINLGNNLPAKTSETCGLYIDASGNISTGLISGGTGGSGFTISNNGLCNNGSTTVGLGGTLSENTTINTTGLTCYWVAKGSDSALVDGIYFDNSNAAFIGKTWCSGDSWAGGYFSTGGVQLDAQDSIAGTSSCLQLHPNGNACVQLSNVFTISSDNLCPAQYASDYSAAYTCLSIPNAGWVTGQTGGGSGFTISNNGLCDNGTTVGLGGTLSNTTVITGGSQTFCICDVGTTTIQSNATDMKVGTQSGTVCLFGQAKSLITGCGVCADIGPLNFCAHSSSGSVILQGFDRIGLTGGTGVGKGIYMGNLESGTQTDTLYVDADGKLYCGAAGGGGGTPGGADTNVQFNSGGSFSGTSAFTFNGSHVGVTGTITSSGDMTATDFVLSSDETLKTSICSLIPTCVDVCYREYEFCNKPGNQRYGVIAQELNMTQPEFVRCDNDGIMSVSYIDLLVREVAYLKNKVEELEKKIG